MLDCNHDRDYALPPNELESSTAELDTGYTKSDFILPRGFENLRQRVRAGARMVNAVPRALDTVSENGIGGNLQLNVGRKSSEVNQFRFDESVRNYDTFNRRLQRRTRVQESPLFDLDRVELATVDYFSYFLTVEMPGRQRFRAMFDTGSADFWVPDLYTCVSAPCVKRNRFDSNLSDTVELRGEVVREEFGIVGLQLPFTAAPDNLFRLGLAATLPLPLINQTFDGILGDFWGTNPEHFRSPLTWFPLAGNPRPTHWELNLVSTATLGSREITLKSKTALVDTGSPIIGMPYEDAKSFNDALGATPDPQSNGQTSLLPCPNIAGSGNSNLPKLSFRLLSGSAPISFTLTPADYAIPDPHQPGYCLSAIVPTSSPNQDGSNFWILGDPFLRSYYAAFDYENLVIGLAKTRIPR
ncbi:hypothetical protein L0F63_005625 [Massospora cicadina]|nr:hypothetical protein L0F63_005625 [Massospora cicadina]